ncbi:hypothetical protein J437_LFUL011105 [Ladona fulva]|uniref:Peptidase S1 domain-containing protein n=1 Tax=Ladona fulva TaxID=123851 RepID=A0A8K0P8E4_LADFU|nr:hypothetical protein J437_LFUL011105 [Ladona fulva]
MRPASYLLIAIAHLQIISFSTAADTQPVTSRVPGETAKKSDTQPVTSRVPGETAKKWCKVYQKSCPIQVGKSDGNQAYPGEFPHMAAIGYGEESGIKWHCGGALISEKFVLSAAHCSNSPSVGPPKWVLLGAVFLINTTATDGSKGQIHPIMRIIRHPEYKAPANYNDIVLFEIGPAITPNPRPLNSKELHPACLSENRTLPGKQALATGWGRVEYFGDTSPNLLIKHLQILELSVCEEAFKHITKKTLSMGFVPSMLCAGVLPGKRDTCQGDGGAPLHSFLMNECTYEVWGVTSFGSVCGDPKKPSVYTKVFAYISWIEDIVWPA